MHFGSRGVIVLFIIEIFLMIYLCYKKQRWFDEFRNKMAHSQKLLRSLEDYTPLYAGQ